MTKSSQTIALVFAFAVASTTLVRAQDKPGLRLVQRWLRINGRVSVFR